MRSVLWVVVLCLAAAEGIVWWVESEPGSPRRYTSEEWSEADAAEQDALASVTEELGDLVACVTHAKRGQPPPSSCPPYPAKPGRSVTSSPEPLDLTNACRSALFGHDSGSTVGLLDEMRTTIQFPDPFWRKEAADLVTEIVADVKERQATWRAVRRVCAPTT
jgi:hypothetical protein